MQHIYYGMKFDGCFFEPNVFDRVVPSIRFNVILVLFLFFLFSFGLSNFQKM